ncbi:MAG: J domain-containing protein [Lachnospiraceae bacterium]|nr:J domain-containing protein [Lachnospiraceae bacterium]
MIHAVIAVIVMVVILLIYGAMMLFTDYIKVTSYAKGMIINIAWFFMATGYAGYEVYYPSIFENKWLNFAFMTAGILLIVFEISKFVKLRNAFVISAGTVTHLLISIMILNFIGGIPGWAATIYLVVSSCIVLAIHIAAVYVGKNTEPGNFVSRVLAGLLMMPAPFLITSAGMLASQLKTDYVIKAVPLKEFIRQVYDFLGNPDFNFSVRFLVSDLHYTRTIFLVALIISLLLFAIYIVIDSTVNYRSDMKERSRHRKEAEQERVRAEISARIHAQLEKIDSCMSYISTNFKILKVRDEEMKELRRLYDEATRIKYSYNGTASGQILKRLTEIKTEIYIIRDRIINRMDPEHAGPTSSSYDHSQEQYNGTGEKEAYNSGEQGAGKESKTENAGNAGNREDSAGVVRSHSTISEFFNGCTTEEEIKKRYRDLSKVFHPDSLNGDQETFLTIKKDYEDLMARFSVREG